MFSVGTSERLTAWREIDTVLNSTSINAYGQALDTRINDATIAINALLGGYFTRMSCEGHPDTSSSPWITFGLVSIDGARHADLDVITNVVARFNTGRGTPDLLRVGIYPMGDETASHSFELTTAIGHELTATDYDPETWSIRAQSAIESLAEQQQEMQELAAFMRNEFLLEREIRFPNAVTL